MLGKMAGVSPCQVFAHKCTVRLIIDDDMRIDALQVIASLPSLRRISLALFLSSEENA